MTPTQRTLKALRDRGLTANIVERFIANGRVGFGHRSDLLEIIDIIAVSPKYGIIGVQSCGVAFAQHYKKITQEKAQNSKLWLDSGGKLELYGWRKVKLYRGAKKMVVKPRHIEITLADLEL